MNITVATIYKKASDRALGPRGKWTLSYVGPDGRRIRKAGFTSRQATERYALELEADARRIRDGLAEPGERERRTAANLPLARHLDDYRHALLARGDTPKHAAHTAGVLARLLADAGITTIAALPPDRIQGALGRLKARRSARTTNHALAAVRAFCLWLAECDRIRQVPKGLASIPPYNEAADRKRVRRALSPAELAALVAAAETGRDLHTWPRRSKTLAVVVPGPMRAACYLTAMATGFRDRELRSLTLESFRLDGAAPAITVAAGYTKNGKLAVQPIARDTAARLKAWLAGRPPGAPVFRLPWSSARMLRVDLEAAGIAYETTEGVVDMHALRHSFITNLIASGVDVKTCQSLARHSTPTLTIGRYAHTDDARRREAIEGSNGEQPVRIGAQTGKIVVQSED